MGLMILFSVLTVVPIFVWVIVQLVKPCESYKEAKIIWSVIGTITSISLVTLFSLGMLLVLARTVKQSDYEIALDQKIWYEYRLSHINDDNASLYENIRKFNRMLEHEKYWSSNPWTNIFYNDDIATIDYIIIGEE